MNATRATPSSRWIRAAAVSLVVAGGATGALGRDFFCGGVPLFGDATAARSFGAWEDNMLVAQWTHQPGWIAKRERALHGQYSVKYTIVGEHYSRVTERRSASPPNASSCAELFFAYTGAFDFYLKSRPSDPVVGRKHNPGLFLRIPLKLWIDDADRDDQLHLSIEHLSNGQTFDASTPEGIERARRAYERRDRPFFDTISRGSNFVAADLMLRPRWAGRRVDLRAKFKGYFGGDENTVSWGPHANRKVRDYDQLTLHAGIAIARGMRVELDWRLGREYLETDSWDVGFQWRLFGLPWYVRYHHGPYGNLANFTQEERSLGVGFRFAFD